MCGMLCVQAHMADFMIVGVDDRDLVLFLKHLHADVDGKHIRNAARPTLIAGRRVGPSGARHLAMLLHDLGGLRLQDWTAVVADEFVWIARSIPQGQISYRTGTGLGRLDVRKCEMRPYARKVRNGCGGVARAVRG